TDGTVRGRAVAGRARVAEDRAPEAARRRILREHVDRLAAVRREGFLQAPVVGLLLLRVLLLRRPFAVTGHRAEAREPEQVTDAEGDRDPEQVDPPLRQRLVVFGDVLVPVMAGVFRLGIAGAALARPPQQPPATDDVQRDDRDHVTRPATTRSRCRPPCQFPLGACLPRPCRYATTASSSVLPRTSFAALAICASVYGSPSVFSARMCAVIRSPSSGASASHGNEGMFDSGTTARGSVRCTRCQSSE